ncbi:MAG: hypothetical protein WCW93_01790 [Candidatus Paceibacterota bacterium]
MPIKVLDETPELRDILDKTAYTLKLRLVTLISFFLGVLLIWSLDFFPHSQYTWLTVLIIFFWIISALIFKTLVKKMETVSGISNLYLVYSTIFELFFLTIIIYANGGIVWIGVIFYLFTIIYCNIVLDKIKGTLVSLVAFLWFGALTCLEYFQIIPYIPFAQFRENLYLDPKYVVATLSFVFVTFILSGLATSGLTDILRKRTGELEKTKVELEKSKAVLEERVLARTKELQDIANNLDNQVQKRTEDLENKMKDLKRFQELSVDRELKMVELKEEIKKITNAKINTTN